MIEQSLLYLEILLPAFVAGLLVLSTHVPLGREVLKRGIIFLDLAVAQIAGMGIILAGLLGLAPHGWELQCVAFVSAIIGAGLLSLLEKKVGKHQEAIIGCFFILAATGSLLLLSSNPHGGESLKKILVGQVLWVEWKQLLLPAVFSIIILGLWFFKPCYFQGKWFYILFAVAITNSVQLVGVYLVFSCLIVPALLTRYLSDSMAMLIGLLFGVLSFLIGLIISTLFDLPSGAVIVWVMALIAFGGSFLMVFFCRINPDSEA